MSLKRKELAEVTGELQRMNWRSKYYLYFLNEYGTILIDVPCSCVIEQSPIIFYAACIFFVTE